MRYLVTGGAGFIGSHLCQALVARGDVVVALDDLSAGRRANLAAIAADGAFSFVAGSALDRGTVGELVAEVDGVFHLAADVGVRHTLRRPSSCWQRNTGGAETVLTAAAQRGVRTLVASTSEIYGPCPPVPVSEAAPTVPPAIGAARWAYAASKAFAEDRAAQLRATDGLPVVVARVFNTVGPRQSPCYGMVLPNLVEQALRGEDLTVHGDGRQRRCFCDVEDTVAALCGLFDEDRAIGRTVNVGGDQEVSIVDLAATVITSTGSSSGVRLVPYQQAYGPGYVDVRRRVPDLSAVVTLLGWRARHDLDAMIDRVARCTSTELVGLGRR
jgi:UDP-glucose 4-epimerase